MKNSHPSARAGFTLIELLMVVLIIGLLSGLLLVAVTAGVRKAQEATVATEIEQLAMAAESFKSDTGTYPLAMGFRLRDNRSGGDFSADYHKRLTRTASKVFPRYSGGINKLAEDINFGTKHVKNGLTIDNLDPAESLVFWLGGLPDPESETKLLGFRSDPSQPFNYLVDSTLPFDDPVNAQAKDKGRKPPRFPFVASRLVDRDDDGWLEYIPQGTPSSGADMPPYVFFDNVSYGDWPAYPIIGDSVGAANGAVWGTAIPYAADGSAKGADTTTDPVTPPPAGWKIQWMNSQKFQIIAPGRDGSYGGVIPADYFTLSIEPTKLFNDLRLLPSCQRLRPYTDDADRLQFDLQLDNQTNFTTGKLGDDRP